jgi:hypothetical protein
VVGLKVTPMVHVPEGTTVPQVFVTIVNCVGLVPTRVTPDTTRLALPVLLIVITRATEIVPLLTEPKASAAGETTAIGAAVMPIPLKATLEGDPVAL